VTWIRFHGLFNSIRGRLLLLVGVVLLPTLLIQALIYKDRYELRRSDEFKANMEVARGISMAFGEFVKDVLHQELVIGLALASGHLPREGIQIILEQSAVEHKSVLSYAWVDPGGTITNSSFSSDQGVDLSSYNFFQEMEAGGEAHVSNLFLLQESGKPVFTINRSFREANGTLVGFVVAVVDPALLDTALDLKREGGGAFGLWDRSGRQVFRYPALEFSWEDRDMSGLPFIQDALKGKEYTVEDAVGIDGVPRAYALTPIDAIGWFAGASRPTAEIYAVVQARLLRHAGMFLAVILISLPLAAYFAHTISSPLRTLRGRALQEGWRGDDHPEAVGGPSEIQDLSLALQRARAAAERRLHLLGEAQSELRKARDELEERVKERTAQLSRLKTVFDESERISGTISWEWDLSRDEFTFSHNFFNVHGVEVDRTTGVARLSMDDLMKFPHPDDMPAVQSALRRTMNGGGPYDIAHRIVRRNDGGIRFIHARGELISDELGRPAYVRGWAQDITELTAIENRLRRANLELQAANRSKDEFLANMSHEIRTPMSGVLGMTDMLLQHDLPEQVRRDLEMVRSSSGTILTLLNDLLDLSRIEQGKLELESSPFNLKEMINTLERPFEIQAVERGIRFSVSIAENVPEYVNCDPDRIGQVLKNLLSNAFKFTTSGSVSLSVHLEKEAGHLSRLRFTVSDTGIGIPEEMLRPIFQPFTQIDPSYSKKFAGAGLGLAISKRLIDLMGGEITVQSSVGEGTTFSFTVGFEKAEPGEALAPEDRLTLSDLPSLAILLAEDNQVNRIFLRRALAAAGHRVGEAENGAHALEKLESTRFDLVLMDIQMPEMDGIEATLRIRSGRHGRADIPIIALTAYAMKGDREKFLGEGMNGYVTKPVDFGELARTIAEVCGV
jgi:signal transduction histidine kinase